MKLLLPLLTLCALTHYATASAAGRMRVEGRHNIRRFRVQTGKDSAGQASQYEQIKKILNDTTLWGKDFPQVLRSLPLIAGSGEKTVLVFHGVVVGGTPFPNLPQSLRAIDRASAANRILNDTRQGEAFKRSLGVRSDEVITLFYANPFLEDNSQRLTLERAGGEYLLPNTVAALKRSQGEPQKVSKVRVNGYDEDRPEVLTYYEYAGGAVIFVMHNYKRYGYINRAILNIPAVQSALSVNSTR